MNVNRELRFIRSAFSGNSEKFCTGVNELFSENNVPAFCIHSSVGNMTGDVLIFKGDIGLMYTSTTYYFSNAVSMYRDGDVIRIKIIKHRYGREKVLEVIREVFGVECKVSQGEIEVAPECSLMIKLRYGV